MNFDSEEKKTLQQLETLAEKMRAQKLTPEQLEKGAALKRRLLEKLTRIREQRAESAREAALADAQGAPEGSHNASSTEQVAQWLRQLPGAACEVANPSGEEQKICTMDEITEKDEAILMSLIDRLRSAPPVASPATLRADELEACDDPPDAAADLMDVDTEASEDEAQNPWVPMVESPRQATSAQTQCESVSGVESTGQAKSAQSQAESVGGVAESPLEAEKCAVGNGSKSDACAIADGSSATLPILRDSGGCRGCPTPSKAPSKLFGDSSPASPAQPPTPLGSPGCDPTAIPATPFPSPSPVKRLSASPVLCTPDGRSIALGSRRRASPGAGFVVRSPGPAQGECQSSVKPPSLVAEAEPSRTPVPEQRLSASPVLRTGDGRSIALGSRRRRASPSAGFVVGSPGPAQDECPSPVKPPSLVTKAEPSPARSPVRAATSPLFGSPTPGKMSAASPLGEASPTGVARPLFDSPAPSSQAMLRLTALGKAALRRRVADAKTMAELQAIEAALNEDVLTQETAQSLQLGSEEVAPATEKRRKLSDEGREKLRRSVAEAQSLEELREIELALDSGRLSPALAARLRFTDADFQRSKRHRSASAEPRKKRATRPSVFEPVFCNVEQS